LQNKLASIPLCVAAVLGKTISEQHCRGTIIKGGDPILLILQAGAFKSLFANI
jgi:hypothetical protein